MTTYLYWYPLMISSFGRANEYEDIPIKRNDARDIHSYPTYPDKEHWPPHYLLYAPTVVFCALVQNNSLYSSLKPWYCYQLKLYLLPINFNISLVCSTQYPSPGVRVIIIRISLGPCCSQFLVDVDSPLVVTGRGLEGCFSFPC